MTIGVYIYVAASEMLEDEEDVFDDLDTASLDLEESYVVTKDYAKLDVDELDLFEGQVVCIIDDSDIGEYTEASDLPKLTLISSFPPQMCGTSMPMGRRGGYPLTSSDLQQRRR